MTSKKQKRTDEAEPQITFRLPKSDRDKLLRVAEEHGISVSDVVRMCIRREMTDPSMFSVSRGPGDSR